MFQENGDPCVEHNGEGMCIYALDVEEGTISTGACDCSSDRN